MMRMIGIAGVLTVAVGCSQQSTVTTGVIPNSTTVAASFNSTGAPTVEFALPDMMCEDGCAQAVKDILTRQPGAKDVRVDFEAKTATVAVDEGAFDSQQALAALIDKGFDKSVLATADADAAEKAEVKPDAESESPPAAQ
jgi:copper chaperone CopZ